MVGLAKARPKNSRNQVPYSHRFKAICDAVLEDKSFCLKEVDDLLKLDHSHAQYHQIHTQLFVCA